ncbi:MAG TPA: hypothetical protein PLV45_18010, partial [bacterium]|nr:hypothetical protein [bacterium]
FRFNDRVGLSRHHLRTSGTTTVVGDEYLPLTVHTHPETLYGPRDSTWHLDAKKAVCVPDRDDSAVISGFIISDTPVPVRVNCLFFPGWHATLDRRPVPLIPDPVTGLMRLDVPPGDHTVEIRFGSTPIRTAGAMISGAALLIGLALLIPKRHHGARSAESHTPEGLQ